MNPDKIFKVLSDETRMRIVYLIKQQKELCVCELTEALDIIQPKISRHLAVLRNSGLLKSRREGQWIFYSFVDQMPEWLKLLLDAAVLGCHSDQPFINDLKKLSTLSCKSCA